MTAEPTPLYHLKERGYGTHQALLDLVRPGVRLLDVGAAGGYLSELARDLRGARPLAVDIDERSCAATRARGIEALHGDVAELLAAGAFAGREAFDQIMLADVLEHMTDPAAALRDLVRMLGPKGSIIISVPNIAYLRARVRLLLGVWRYEDTGIFDRTHLRFFTRATVRELVESAGLEIVREIPIGPANYLFGRPGGRITALRPQLLASQLVMEVRPTA